MAKIIFPLLVAALIGWAVWSEVRIAGLEIRLNPQEASQHWQDTPPEVQR